MERNELLMIKVHAERLKGLRFNRIRGFMKECNGKLMEFHDMSSMIKEGAHFSTFYAVKGQQVSYSRQIKSSLGKNTSLKEGHEENENPVAWIKVKPTFVVGDT